MRNIKQKIMAVMIVCSILNTQVVHAAQTSVELHKKEKEDMSQEWQVCLGSIVGAFAAGIISLAFEELGARRKHRLQRRLLSIPNWDSTIYSSPK